MIQIDDWYRWLSCWSCFHYTYPVLPRVLLVKCGQISMVVSLILIFVGLYLYNHHFFVFPQYLLGLNPLNSCLLELPVVHCASPIFGWPCQGISSYNHGTLRTFALLDFDKRHGNAKFWRRFLRGNVPKISWSCEPGESSWEHHPFETLRYILRYMENHNF